MNNKITFFTSIQRAEIAELFNCREVLCSVGCGAGLENAIHMLKRETASNHPDVAAAAAALLMADGIDQSERLRQIIVSRLTQGGSIDGLTALLIAEALLRFPSEVLQQPAIERFLQAAEEDMYFARLAILPQLRSIVRRCN